MKKFWVVGGHYADTGFSQIAGNGEEERIGPFPTYEAAKEAWAKRAWETVDQANSRYRIEEEGAEVCYWVVGGPYRDTSFLEPADGGGEEWFGPFAGYDAAKVEWSRHAWASVDDAMCRYRIERLAKGAHPKGAHPDGKHPDGKHPGGKHPGGRVSAGKR